MTLSIRQKNRISDVWFEKFYKKVVERFKKLKLSHLLSKTYNDACGSVYSIIYAAHYKVKAIKPKHPREALVR